MKLHRNDDVPDSAWFATADQIEMSEAAIHKKVEIPQDVYKVRVINY